MRKFVIFLTILVFLACLGFGLYTSYKPDGNKNQVEGRFSPTVSPVSEYQSNYLIIHVDDLLAENPQLISVWGLIAYYPEPKYFSYHFCVFSHDFGQTAGGNHLHFR